VSSRAWIAVLDAAPGGADAAAALTTADGAPAGWLGAWIQASKPVREARRVDPRLIDAGGAEAHVSLVWPDRARGFRAFDDTAVQQARREVQRSAFPPDGVSTLLVDDSHFAGAITVRRGPAAAGRLRTADPFSRLEPARVLTVGAGVVGILLLPAGPVIERHGSAQPWPWAWF
jgi:hypothetical protein